MANVSEMSPSSTEVSFEDTKQPKVSPALAEVAVWLLEITEQSRLSEFSRVR